MLMKSLNNINDVFLTFPEPSIHVEADALRRCFTSGWGSAELADGAVRQSFGRLASLHRRQRRSQAHQRRKS